MFRSRLRHRRKTYPIKVLSRTHSGSTYTEATVSELGYLTATYEQQTVTLTDDQQGTYTEILDVFWFEPDKNDSLPAIVRGHVLQNTDTESRYDVQNVDPQGGNDGRLKVETKKIEWPI